MPAASPFDDARFHNDALAEWARKARGSLLHRVDELWQLLHRHGMLRLTALPTGLYPASGAASTGVSGYGNVWVRDNVFVAHAEWEAGRSDAAARVGRALLAFYRRHRHRLEAIIAGDASADGVMQRPHVRFDGTTLEEISLETWPHAQNDALGYCLWLCARLARSDVTGRAKTDVFVVGDNVVYLTSPAAWRRTAACR